MTARVVPMFGARAASARIKQARHVVTNPHAYADRPQLRLLAWAILKTAQGKPLRQRRVR